MKKFIKGLLIVTILLTPAIGKIHAENLSVNLIIRDGNTLIFNNSVPLQAAGIVELNGHQLSSNSVLSVLNDADISSENFSITDLQYFDSFGSFLLNCISSSVGNDCYDWHYAVNGSNPNEGMDKKNLIGGENIYIYFSPQNRVNLSSNSINITDTLTVTAERYNYEDNTWENENNAILGVTKPDPLNSYNPPIEVMTSPTDSNGQAIFTSIPEGTYDVGIRYNYGFYFPTKTLTVTNALPISNSHPVNSTGNYHAIDKTEEKTKPTFDTAKAFDFLISQQKENGSFGEELYTDWAALALMKTDKYQDQKIKLIKYFTSEKFSGISITDYERHVIALMTFGVNPYNIYPDINRTTEGNYIKKITDNFDGKQFGDPNKDNDDIFALIVLQNAGYTEKDKLILDTISFILNKQNTNGSWDDSIDLTGAGMESLSAFQNDPKIKTALERAKNYLKENQKNDGGFGNISSTAWAMQGILAIGEKPADWIKNDKTPIDYLAVNQEIDGGIKDENIENRIWQTSYVLTSLFEKTWNNSMQKFPLPIIENNITPNDTIKNFKEITKNNKATLKNNKIETIEKLDLQANTSIMEATENTTPAHKQNWLRKLINIFGF